MSCRSCHVLFLSLVPPAACHEAATESGRVYADGIARLELVGGRRPTNNWQYTP
jgi:hypothetical protein